MDEIKQLAECLLTLAPGQLLYVAVDGVFLMREELAGLWVDISFETSLNRALQREPELFGSKDVIYERYMQRYIPGQQLYLEESKPQKRANVVINIEGP